MKPSRPSLALDVIRPIASRWVESARASLQRDDALTRAALETSFAWSRAEEGDRERLRMFIVDQFAAIDRVLHDAERIFRTPSSWAVRRYFGRRPPPAYAVSGHVYFTSAFRLRRAGRGFGPMCLAAMVVHESVHVFDARSGEPEIHVSEWDEPRFSAIPPEQQAHNPSAYACYAAQVHHGRLEWPREARFGAGRPRD